MGGVAYHQIIAGAAGFPDADIPMYPPASWSQIVSVGGKRMESVFLRPEALFVRNGRSALAMALKHAGIGAHSQVLLPAYHCPSMIEPTAWLGATIIFYPLLPSLEPDLDWLGERIEDADALLLPHFFGFVQPATESIANLCHAAKTILIEDCAHTFWAKLGSRDAGSFGDYAIASTQKFFPGPEGGALYSARHDLSQLELESVGLKYELRSLVRLCETARRFGRGGLPAAAITGLVSILNSGRQPESSEQREDGKSENGAPVAVDTAPESSAGEPIWFDAADVGFAGARVCRSALKLYAHANMIEQRQKNYLRLQEGLSGLSRAHALHGELRGATAPYAFPLLIDDPEKDFPRLKRERLAIFRWEQLAASDCQVSTDYRTRLLQLPCHQTLSGEELERMVETCRRILQ